MNEDRVRSAADQAAESADDTGDPVRVPSSEWFRLLDAIYDESEHDPDEETENE